MLPAVHVNTAKEGALVSRNMGHTYHPSHDRTVLGGVKTALKKGMIMSVMGDCITTDDIAWIDSIGGETILLQQQPDMSLGKVLMLTHLHADFFKT